MTHSADRKFWNIQLQGKSFTVTFGRIGSRGQTQLKQFPSEDRARAAHDKLIAEKVAKGYVEVGGAPAGPAGKPASPKGKPVAYRLGVTVEEWISSDEPVLLPDQDRARWDRVLIGRGLAALDRAGRCGTALGPYAVQAAIGACHARARTVESIGAW